MKKALKKAKKAALKAEEDAKKAPQPTAVELKRIAEEAVSTPKDSDPLGLQLLKDTIPLDAASKFLVQLETQASDKIETWLASYEVNSRKGKHILALKALRHAIAISPSHPTLHVQLIKFNTSIAALLPSLTGPVHSILEAALAELHPGAVSMEIVNSNYLQANAGNAMAVLACADALMVIRGAAGCAACEELVSQAVRTESRPSSEVSLVLLASKPGFR